MLNPLLIAGMTVVNFALITYSLACFFEVRKRRLSAQVLGFFTAGVLLDITATTLMILGSRKIPITPHGILGYTALAAMLTDVILLWRQKKIKGLNGEISKKLHIYSTIAYCWWVIAYIAGAMLVMFFSKR